MIGLTCGNVLTLKCQDGYTRVMTTKQMSITGRLTETFHSAWTAIQKRHPEVPDVLITIGSGTLQKGKTRLGHFGADRWLQNGSETAVAELFVGGEGLQDGARDVLGTLLHEAAHGLAHVREIQDTSRQGRYHNAKYKALATELGLEITEDPKWGWTVTAVPDATATVYARQIAAIENALVAYRRSEVHTDKSKKSTNLAVATCGCEEPRKIRVAKSALEFAPITCGACETQFTAEEE